MSLISEGSRPNFFISVTIIAMSASPIPVSSITNPSPESTIKAPTVVVPTKYRLSKSLIGLSDLYGGLKEGGSFYDITVLTANFAADSGILREATASSTVK